MSPAAKKRGLGRGLDALLADESQPVRELPVGSLHPNRFQPRREFDEDELRELADSIGTQGVIQPLVVTPVGDGYAIIAGERRWRASQRAGLDRVPVVVREVADDQELLELALVENLQRSDLNPIEEAEAYRELRDTFGLSQGSIATRVGKARSTVANALRLLNLPEEILAHLASGRLTAGHARPLLTLEETERQVALAREVVTDGLTVRDVERRVTQPAAEASNGTGGSRKATVGEPEIYAAAAADKLTQKLQTKVEIRRRGRGGTIDIHFHSEDELIRLHDLLMDRGGRR